jgi:benzil reductase ((S)-benzoin forming)
MRKYFITGISKGIGKELFLLLSQTNNVVGLSRLNISYKYNTNNAQIIYLDLCNVNKLLEFEITDYFNETDDIIFINNAAKIEPINIIENITIQEVLSSFTVNVFAVFIFLQKLIKLCTNKQLYVFNLTTGAADKPIPGWSVYCSSKSAIHMILDVLSVEKENTIKLRHYDPGVVDTEMQEYIRSRKEDNFPLVEKFTNYKNENKLRKASEVANEIIDIINEDCNII